MTEKFRNFIRGFSSIFDLYPDTDYSKFVPSESSEDLIREDWAKVGEALQQAIESWEHGERTTNTTEQIEHNHAQ